MLEAAVASKHTAENNVYRCFAVLAIVLAIMVGIGKQSWTPPILIVSSVLASWLLTDRFRVIELDRLTGYLGMLLGAGLAISGYLFNRPSQSLQGAANLDAVAKMLVYIQIPLMFQRKDKRLFEHWGVFLILELVVAALLGDNALFGILLFPTLLLSCLAMMYLATYVTHLELESSATASLVPMLSGWFATRKSSSSHVEAVIQFDEALSLNESTVRRRSPWIALLCLGVGLAIFAMVYFFGLPRLHTGAYEGLGFSRPMVGFSGTVRLEDVGRLMVNNELALRVFLADSKTNEPFVPVDPPYLRGTVVDFYQGQGKWGSRDPDTEIYPTIRREQLRREIREEVTPISVIVQEQSALEGAQFSFVPFFTDTRSSELHYNPMTWCLRDPVYNAPMVGKRQRYRFETIAFADNFRSAWLLEPKDMLGGALADEEPRYYPPRHMTRYGEESDFKGLIEVRDKILRRSQRTSKLDQVILLEDYLASSNNFRYSLEPQVDYTNGLDPIEDFVVNHRTGHCQYFASALAIMARTLKIPSRIVLGFRPGEYNEVGKFFAVRQRHAHAWVEVYLTKEDFRDSLFNIPDWVEGGLWLRLDPTPAGEGSNAGGSLRQGIGTNQAFETLEQFWQDGFMEFDGSRQPSMFGWFSSNSNGPIAAALRSMETYYLQLQTKDLTDVSFSTERWFSWQASLIAGGIAMLVAFTAVLLRSPSLRWLPRWQSNRRRASDSHSDSASSRRVPLFDRSTAALKALGWERQPHQTATEFIDSLRPWLLQLDGSSFINAQSMATLRDFYLYQRFRSVTDETDSGTKTNDNHEQIEQTVIELEKLASTPPKST